MCETAVTNKDGKVIRLHQQRGSNCGLYALLMVLEYLCDIDYPATKGDKEGATRSLRELFKENDKTIIGEIYNADEFALFVNEQFGDGLCSCESFDLRRMKQITDEGGLCMVPFSVDASTGSPSDSGDCAHWCVIQSCTEDSLKACHWGSVYDFLPNALESSNSSIASTRVSYYGKVEGKKMDYVKCAAADSTHSLEGDPIKAGSIKEIPESLLAQTLAKKMIVFHKP